MAKKTEKKKKTLTHYEEQANKFVPGDFGAGTLLRARRDIQNVLNLKNLKPEVHKEEEVSFVLNQLVNPETNECALIMLKGETRVMHISSNFELDYEIVCAGTTEMNWENPVEDSKGEQ